MQELVDPSPPKDVKPGSLGFWMALNQEELRELRRRHDQQLAEALYGVRAVIDEAGPPYVPRPRSLAMKELQRLRCR